MTYATNIHVYYGYDHYKISRVLFNTDLKPSLDQVENDMDSNMRTS